MDGFDVNSLSSMGLTELSAVLDREVGRLDAQEQRLEQARQQHRSARSQADNALFAVADTPQYDQLHSELMKPANKAIAEAESEVSRIAEQVRQAALRVVELTGSGQVSLTDEEMVAASARMAFIKEDAESLPLSAIRDRIQTAIQDNDRPAMFCWIRYGRLRLTSADTGPKTLPNGMVELPAVDASATRSQIAVLLSTAERKLANETADPVNRRAKDVLSKAGALGRKVARRTQRQNDRELGERLFGKGQVSW